MQRSRLRKPSKKIISAILGENVIFAKDSFLGLEEISFSEIYPVLNLTELLIFSSGSWKFRENNIDKFRFHLEYKEIHSLFEEIISFGLPRYNHVKNFTRLNTKQLNKCDNLNPYNGNLKERVNMLSREVIDKLRDDLFQETKTYAFNEVEYLNLLKNRKNKKEKVKVKFQNSFYKRRDPLAFDYISEINRKIKMFPIKIYSNF